MTDALVIEELVAALKRLVPLVNFVAEGEAAWLECNEAIAQAQAAISKSQQPRWTPPLAKMTRVDAIGSDKCGTSISHVPIYE